VILGQREQRVYMVGRPTDDDGRAVPILENAGLIRVELGADGRRQTGSSVFRAVNEVDEIHRQ